MIQILQPISISIVFLVANLVVLRFILWSNQRPSQLLEEAPLPAPANKANLAAGEILGWEFEYARTTASESMQDRHTMINFYLLVVGVVASGVVTLLSATPDPGQATTPRNTIGTVLLWLLCMIGWFYFLSIIRLRQAWYGSARAMNRIKDFCIQHADGIEPNILRKAFLWQSNTLPPPHQPWTVFFYAAMLIGFLDSVAYVAGGTLILVDLKAMPPDTWWPQLLVVLMGFCFFLFHIWLYFAFLRPAAPTPPANESAASTAKESSMPTQPIKPGDDQASVQILDEVQDYAFGNIFRVVRAKLRYRRFDGKMSEPVTRLNFERGASVGVLLYDRSEDAVILVRQFRYPVYASLGEHERAGAGAERAWLLEIVAGVQDAGLTVTDVAKKELLEEAGYEVVGDLQPITTIYPSPGGTSERIHLYLGEVDQRSRTGTGGGVVAEGEDTQIVNLPFQQAMDMVARGDIRDAKTVVALQHLALHKS